MAPVGYCCNYASDCKSGICIEQACRSAIDPVEVRERHSDKTAMLVVAVMGFIIIAVLISLCIMFHCNNSNLELEVQKEQ